jgi:hypothetical protein
MRRQFFEATSRLSRQALEDVLEVLMRVMSIKLRRMDETHDGRGALTGAQRSGGRASSISRASAGRILFWISQLGTA